MPLKTLMCLQACHKCNQTKQASEFYRNRTNPDGLYNNCKECFATNSKRRQEALPPIEERMAISKVRARAQDQGLAPMPEL